MKRFLSKVTGVCLSLALNLSYFPVAHAAGLPTVSFTSNYDVLNWEGETKTYYITHGANAAPNIITWSTNNADSVTLNNAAVAASGTQDVAIQNTPLVYTLTATNSAGTVTKTLGIMAYPIGYGIPNFMSGGGYSLQIYSSNENVRPISPDTTITVAVNQPITFYADFKKGGSHVAGADCHVKFIESNTFSYSSNVQTTIIQPMVDNGTIYTAVRSFAHPIDMVYDIKCSNNDPVNTVTLNARDFTLIDIAPDFYYYWRPLSSADKQRLVTPEDIEYLGAFMPGGSAGSRFGFGLTAMTYYPQGDPSGPSDGFPGSLFAWGHVYELKVSEISIPTPVISMSKEIADLPVSTSLQSFADPSGGIFAHMTDKSTPAGYDFNRPGGLMYLPKQGSQTSDKLYWSYTNGYPSEYNIRASAGWSELNLSNPQGAGPWSIGAYNFQATSSYMFGIDKVWADTYTGGRYIATGQSGASITSTYSHGPALIAYGPWLDGNPPAPQAKLSEKTLLFYPPGEPEHALMDADGTGYSGDGYAGGAWVTGAKSSVIFVRNKTVGGWFYEAGRLGACIQTTGDTVWPKDVALVFYDPDELAQVALGNKQSWEPKPYLSMSIRKYLKPVCEYQGGGMAYDKDHGLIFLSEGNGESPLIHVYQINDSSCRKIHSKTGANANTSLTLSDNINCAAGCNTSPTFTAAYKQDGNYVPGATCSMAFEDGTLPMTDTGSGYTASKSFSAPGTYLYKVTCTKAGVNPVTVPASMVITCGGGVPVLNFAASPEAITLGVASTLSWSAPGATSVSIDQGIGPVSTSGSQVVVPSQTTTYKITASNGAGTVSRQATVTVDTSGPPANNCGNGTCEAALGENNSNCPADCVHELPPGSAPLITTQPVGISVGAGQPAPFSLVAAGDPPLLYQWESRLPGASSFLPIQGANSALFTFNNPQSSDNGTDFRCVVSNNFAPPAISNIVTLTVFAAAPVISVQPQNQSVTAGQPATFGVTVEAFPPITYLWQSKAPGASGFSDINNSNSQTYTTAATALSDSGKQFRVLVTNPGGGPITSAPASLTVTTAAVPPSIVQNPQDKSVTAGQNATFTVIPAGSAPFTYQWQSAAPGSSTFNNIPNNATGSSFTATSVTTGMSGTRYRVRISNSAGGPITSGQATLTVNASLVAPTILVSPQSITVNVNQNASFQVLASGSDPMSYQWQKKAPGASSFSNIQGANTPRFTQFNAQISDSGTQFQCRISNVVNFVTTMPVTLTVTPAGTGAPVLNLLLPINGSTVPGALVTAAYYSTGDLTAVHHVQLQLDSDAPVQGQSLSGVYTFINVISGTHILKMNLAAADNTPIAGTDVAVAFTMDSGGGTAGSLPQPTLNLPAYISVNGNLTAGYASGHAGVGFAWTISPQSSGNGSGAGSPKLTSSFKAPSANFKTSSSVAPLNGYNLVPGLYTVTVQAFDAQGNTSLPAQQDVTLVSADFSALRVFPNPWRANRNAAAPITFDHLPLGSAVKIFTVSGHWVNTVQPTIDTATWDLTNNKGDKVASGIYVYVIKNGDEKATGQIHVIK